MKRFHRTLLVNNYIVNDGDLNYVFEYRQLGQVIGRSNLKDYVNLMRQGVNQVQLEVGGAILTVTAV